MSKKKTLTPSGYHVEPIVIEGRNMKQITTPDGRKIRAEESEKLLVINGEPKYMFVTGDDLLTGIRTYAGESQFFSYSLRNDDQVDVTSTGEHIMFVRIVKLVQGA